MNPSLSGAPKTPHPSYCGDCFFVCPPYSPPLAHIDGELANTGYFPFMSVYPALTMPGTWEMGGPLHYYSWPKTSRTSLGLWLRAGLCISSSQAECQLGCRKQELPANISDKLLIDSIQPNKYLLRTSSNTNKNLATTTRIPTVCQVLYIHDLTYSV